MNRTILKQLKSYAFASTLLCLLICCAFSPAAASVSGSIPAATSKVLPAAIKGKVVDSTGFALPGATVKIKGTPKVTLTDQAGAFAIDANPGDVLVVSYTGYITKEIKITNDAFITETLRDNNTALQEVVVVGYGSVKKTDLTGSVGSVKGEDLNLGGTTANIGQALQCKIAGALVQQTSFAPGGAISITIRGGNSINTSNAPLYVIDGFISDNGNAVNPNDIEDIEVLKDASATAIYGSRGGNGVVLITTKKGKLGKASIDADVSNGRQYLTYKPSLLTGAQYAAIQNATAIEDGKPAPFGASTLIANTSWLAASTQNATVANRNVSISSADKNSKLYISGNYINQLGVLKNTSMERYSARIC